MVCFSLGSWSGRTQPFRPWEQSLQKEKRCVNHWAWSCWKHAGEKTLETRERHLLQLDLSSCDKKHSSCWISPSAALPSPRPAPGLLHSTQAKTSQLPGRVVPGGAVHSLARAEPGSGAPRLPRENCQRAKACRSLGCPAAWGALLAVGWVKSSAGINMRGEVWGEQRGVGLCCGPGRGLMGAALGAVLGAGGGTQCKDIE